MLSKRHQAYLKSVRTHRKYVREACAFFEVPWAQAAVHDWDKFLPGMFNAYANTFYNEDGSKAVYRETPEFAYAWMKHQHRQPHHWQYWLKVGNTPIQYTNILVWDRGTASMVFPDGVYNYAIEGITPLYLPEEYVREMVADWVGAGRAYNTDWTPNSTKDWYLKNRGHMILHPVTHYYVAELLDDLVYSWEDR